MHVSFRLQWHLSSFSGESFKDLGQRISPWVRVLKMMKVEGLGGTKDEPKGEIKVLSVFYCLQV